MMLSHHPHSGVVSRRRQAVCESPLPSPLPSLAAQRVTRISISSSSSTSTSSSSSSSSYTSATPTFTHQLVYTLCAAPGHAQAQHPECPQRVTAIAEALQRHALHAHPRVSQLRPRLTADSAHQDSRLQEALQLVHPPGCLSRLAAICASLDAPSMVDDSTYISPGSYAACCEAAGAVLDVLDVVLGQHAATPHQGFCVVRPPGHHVKASRPMGFGLLNFIAVAAAHARRCPGINKVLVLDWDVHHGNGTEDAFFDSPSVLYVSTHQQGLWPYTGKLNATGAGPGKGATINVPLPGDAGHASMQAVWRDIVLPAARRFQPDLILCSAGCDAHYADPLAGLQFTAATYHMLAQQSSQLAHELCSGRCMWVLEGGYHLPSLAASVVGSFLGALGEPGLQADAPAAPPGGAWLREEPLHKVADVIQRVQALHGLLQE